MANETFPLLSKSEVDCPDDGLYVVFRDKDNGGVLTVKDSDCNFIVIGVQYIADEVTSQIASMIDRILDDAGCALKKGVITAEQYESIVDNFNICFDVKVDPVTGSYMVCVENEPTLFISLVLTHVLCNGGATGTATPTISGGTAPYVLDWAGDDPAALDAGIHTFTVTDANGKTLARSFIITEPAALSAVSSSTPDSGGGDGTATVVVSGGTAPYTYLWDDGGAQTTATATGLSAGDYNCVVTDDNGCVLNVGPITVA